MLVPTTNPKPTTPSPTPDAAMTFDAAPVTTDTPVPAPVNSTSQATNTADAQMTFDAGPITTPLTLPDVSQPQTSTLSAISTGMWGDWGNGTISAVPAPTSAADRFERWTRNVAEDLKFGTDLTGIGTVLKKMGAHGVYSGNPQAVGDFVASLPLGLAKAGTGSAELLQTGKRWQGTKDTIGGLLDATSLPASFANPGELAGSAGDAVLTQAENAAKAVGNAVSKTFSVDSIQQPLKDGIRAVLDTVAKDAGVQPSQGSSIRDVAADLSEAVKAKASALYAQLDKATGGGRFQRFSDALSNIDNAMKDALGVDPEKYNLLEQRKTEVEQAQKAALDAARAAGVDPSLITKANAAWRQQAALSDLGNSIRQTVTGMRPELANAESSLEKLNPKTLFTKINRLNDKGRLADAIGRNNAKALLQHVDSAFLAAQKIANRNKWLGNAATAVGLGSVGGRGSEAVSGLHGLLDGKE